MKARPYPRWISRAFIFATTMLAFTGLLQMPLAKRYYLTELPGMAWTGDFFLSTSCITCSRPCCCSSLRLLSSIG